MDEKSLFYYSSKHIESLFGVSRKRLYYWREIGLFSNGVMTEGGHYRYKFKDLVAIKTIMKIREEGISTYTIKKIVEQLKDHFPDMDIPLAEKSFYIVGKEVMATDKKGSFNPLTGQSTFIKNSDIEKEVKDITMRQFDIPTRKKRAS